ncbi:MAG: DUF1549 domain-containing protein, partial [Candidatus Hydrogenedentes bacterium]|nr:DUF1549 domain-containing protein [Candidatus Hydrogenedentota bacterium]
TTNEGGTIDEENLANYAADRVQTFGWVMLGLTANCAQCHDHKFDPISMKDYYSLAAFFRNTTQAPKDGNVKDSGPVLVVPSMEDRPRWDALPGEIAAASKQRNDRRAAAKPDFDKWVSQATPAILEATMPREGLAFQLPLTEGKGAVVAATLPGAAKFAAAWTDYAAALRTLAGGADADPALGDPRFVSSARLAPALNRLSWNSTTPFL